MVGCKKKFQKLVPYQDGNGNSVMRSDDIVIVLTNGITYLQIPGYKFPDHMWNFCGETSGPHVVRCLECAMGEGLIW